uniref:transcription initiation protein SPT3 homolog n=1 Tax=Styela clava TaxID=7725 RepID=UPI001939F295|nr:transcription initiation protein SPT3 homolog [Styela clava]
MSKHKKKPKMEKSRGWDEFEEKYNPGNASANISLVQNESEIESSSQMIGQPTGKAISFMREVAAMLYAFGDVRHPLKETATLVEKITYDQLCKLLVAAAEVAEKRSSREIGIEEFLYLLRRDESRLSRFAKRLKFLDSRNKIIMPATEAGNDVKVENIEIGEDDDDVTNIVGDSGNFMGKRWQICVEFLSYLDDSGEMVKVISSNVNDEIKTRRLERAELQTRDMNSHEYMEYVKCRQVTFAPNTGKKKFRDWFDFGELNIDIQPSPFGWDSIEYLAQETVAELVDLALIVRSENIPPLIPCEAEPDLRHLPLYASSSLVQRAEVLNTSESVSADLESSSEAKTQAKKSKTDNQASVSFNRKLALKPEHIHEAMRRFNSLNTTAKFLSKVMTISNLPPKTRLLCLS